MNIKFRMTDEEFYLGWNYKKKKSKLTRTTLLITITALCIGFFIFGIISKLYYFAITPVCIGGAIFFMGYYFEKKSIMQEYRFSPYINGEYTLHLIDEGLSIVSSYEKLFVPYGNIFAFEDTKDYVYLIPTFRKGIFVINKERYAGEELDNAIKFLNEKCREGNDE